MRREKETEGEGEAGFSTPLIDPSKMRLAEFYFMRSERNSFDDDIHPEEVKCVIVVSHSTEENSSARSQIRRKDRIGTVTYTIDLCWNV